MPIVDVNVEGLETLTRKEVKRFWAVLGQTVTAPVISSQPSSMRPAKT